MLGATIVLAITYRSSVVPAGDNPDSMPIEGPVATDIDWSFINKLPKAEVKTGVERVDTVPMPTSAPSEYVVHAAQFLREDAAQVLQAELILEGVPATLSSTPRKQGGHWYQVIVGPYATEPDAQAVQKQLLARDIPAQVMTRPIAGPASGAG